MAKVKVRTIELPKGFDFSIDGKKITIRGNGKSITRSFNVGRVNVSAVDGKIKIDSSKSTKREAKMGGTIAAHLINMINGLSEDYVYKLEICNVHFPMNVKVEKDLLVIKSFLGEKIDRTSKILPNVKVEVKGNEITVSSPDLEAAGQTAANIERATRITNRDRRIFQDGIYITSKCGEKL